MGTAMLEYLIKVTNNTLPAVLAGALLLAANHFGAPHRLSSDGEVQLKGRGPLRIPLFFGGVLLGFAAAAGYAALKRNTGYAVREYYDLGALIPSLAASFFSLALLPWAPRGRAPFRVAVFCAVTAWSAYCLPSLLLYPFEFSVGMDTVFDTVFLYKVIG